MGALMVALRWDGGRLSRDQLLGRAQAAVATVQARFNHLSQLNIQAIPDEDGQFVQLLINSDCSATDGESMRAMLKDEFAKGEQIAPASISRDPAAEGDRSDSRPGKPRALKTRLTEAITWAFFSVPISLGLVYLGLRMGGFTSQTWRDLGSFMVDYGHRNSNLGVLMLFWFLLRLLYALCVSVVNLALMVSPVVSVIGVVAALTTRHEPVPGQATTRSRANPAPSVDSTKGNSGSTGACSHCGEPYGEVASLGSQIGGYLCGQCGKRVCDRCCYQKAKSIGRATMICPHCGSEKVTAFRM